MSELEEDARKLMISRHLTNSLEYSPMVLRHYFGPPPGFDNQEKSQEGSEIELFNEEEKHKLEAEKFLVESNIKLKENEQLQEIIS